MARVLDDLPAGLSEPASRSWLSLTEKYPDACTGWPEQQLRVLAVMLACSDYAAMTLLKHWPWFDEGLSRGGLKRSPDVDVPSIFDEGGQAIADEEIRRQLRYCRHRLLLSLLWREYSGEASVEETLLGLSRGADRLVQLACEWAVASLTPRFGQVLDSDRAPVSLQILAMGKLGGRELNFSSDIDLVFLYSAEGETNGPRSLSAQEYFTRLVRQIVSLLDDVSEDGFVYRVDTRLRPFGDSGPLVVSIASLESYLQQHGRDWERYAYVKARLIAQDLQPAAVVEKLHEIIQSFAYRRYLDYGVFESLREMKALIEADIKRRDRANNVKLGPGGIREIEFIVQSLQLVRGGRNPRLRRPELATAVRELVRCDEMTAQTADELLAAYELLRRIENFLQAHQDRQTHQLPVDSPDIDRISLAMGMSTEELGQKVGWARDAVSRHFHRIAFRDAAGRPERDSDALVAAWDSAVDVDHWRGILEQIGVSQPATLAEMIAQFRSRSQVARLDASAGQRTAEFVSRLLRAVSGRGEADKIVERILLIVDKVLRRSAYLAMLNENPALLERLIDICSQSAYFAEEIGRYPVLLDELLDPRIFASAPDAEEMRGEIAERLRQIDQFDSETRVSALGQYQRAAMFRIALADFSGALPVMKVSDALTELAEQILSEALSIAWRDLVAKHGEPWYVESGERRRAGFAVVAYGKLGGLELSYGSDLDLVFLHDSRGNQQQTDGATPLENSVFFSRLVRRLVHFLTTQTPTGALYEVDTRLRPSGRSGLLVTSVEAFERYQVENAWTWEHQALLRSRTVAGHVAVCREFERVRSETLRKRMDIPSLRRDVLDMRTKMRDQLDKSDYAHFDLKQGEGGIGDIEFLVQFLALEIAGQSPAVIFYPDNIRQMGVLAAVNRLGQTDAARLQEIYRTYRARAHRLALDHREAIVTVDDFASERHHVVEIWNREFRVKGQ